MYMSNYFKKVIMRSLTWYVEKDLSSTIHKNIYFKQYKWGTFERNVLHWSRFPIDSAFRVFLSAILFVNAIFLLDVNTKLDLRNIIGVGESLIAWQAPILSAQLTILGVLLPLVIGLVGFLLQSKTASRVTWYSYQRYSAVLFIAMSGILLSAAIIISIYLETYLDEKWLSVNYLILSLWFLFNILMTGRFIFVTFMIVQEDSRENILLRFTIAEAFLDGVKGRIFSNISKNSVNNKILSIKNEFKDSIINRYLDDENFLPVSFNRVRPKYINDINYCLFSAFLNFFIWARNKDVKIKLMPIDSTVASSNIELLRVKGKPPSILERLLLRLSVSLSERKAYESEMTDYVRFFIVGAAIDDLRDDNLILFSESMKRISKWHCALTDSFSYIEDGQQRNWLLLSEGAFSNDYHTELLKEYFYIVKRAIAKIPDSSAYFEEAALLYQRLYARAKLVIPQKMSEDLLHSQYLVWVNLILWSSKVKSDNNARSALATEYENSIITFIGYWEMWRFYVGGKRTAKVSEIEKFEFSHVQLKKTALMVLFSLSENDEMSIPWVFDAFLHWLNSWESGRPNHFVGFWREELLDPSFLSNEVGSRLWDFILNGANYSEEAAISVIRENISLDYRLIMAALICNRFGISKDLDGEPYVNRLISCNYFDSQMSERTSRSYQISPSNVFESFLRLRGTYSAQTTDFSRHIDQFLDMVRDVGRSKLVSGRLYSGSYGYGLAQITEAYIRICIDLSKKPWRLSSQWQDLIVSDFVTDEGRNSILRDIDNWLKTGETLLESGDVEAGTHENFKESISAIQQLVSGLNKSRLKDAEIDQERLIEFGFSASKSGFDRNTSSKYLRLFNDVEHSHDDVGTERRLRIVDYSKAHVSKGIEVNRAVNEEEWLSDSVKDNISRNIFQDLFQVDFTRTGTFEDKLEMLRSALSDAQALQKEGLSPVLILNSSPVSYLLSKLAYGLEDVPDLVVDEAQRGSDESFLVNGVPVLDAPSGKGQFCIVVPKESFRLVRFHEYEQGRFVDVGYENLDQEKLKLDLVLKYSMETKISDEDRFLYKLVAEVVGG